LQQTIQPLASSYRDPSGFMFEKDGVLYRQVNTIFKKDFDHFLSSGCYDHLVKNKLLISHEEVDWNFPDATDLIATQWYKTLKPERIPFISYPYEWCFDMLKDAALLTLQLAKKCIPFGIILKDATAFNVQWLNGQPVFIDTLSFEMYDASKPWIAYRQFCENFLSPLLLMHYTGQPLQALLLAYPEGIPLSITKSLLPWKSRLSFHTYLHIHLHGSLASKSSVKESGAKTNFSEKKLTDLIRSLESLIRSLHWKGRPGNWGNYYEEVSQRNNYLEQKKNIAVGWINNLVQIKTAVDLGANEGEFSFLLAKKNIGTLATDFDHTAITNLYRKVIKKNEKNILPLMIDLSNPSPAIGLNNRERSSFIERTGVDLVLALALIHHLAIGKNIPFEKIAEFFQKITKYLVIEFIPKEDEKIQFMLNQKKDIYIDYTEENFVKAFGQFFLIEKKQPIGDSKRVLYLMKKPG